jgi:hypothetical protein
LTALGAFRRLARQVGDPLAEAAISPMAALSSSADAAMVCTPALASRAALCMAFAAALTVCGGFAGVSAARLTSSAALRTSVSRVSARALEGLHGLRHGFGALEAGFIARFVFGAQAVRFGQRGLQAHKRFGDAADLVDARLSRRLGR